MFLTGMVVDIVQEGYTIKFEPRCEKTNVLVSNLVRHKPGCTAKEDGKMIEI